MSDAAPATPVTTPTDEQGPLLTLIHLHGGTITPRELQHRARRYRGPAQKARDALEDLVTGGFAEWSPDRSSVTVHDNVMALVELGRAEKRRVEAKAKARGEVTGQTVTPEGGNGPAGHGYLGGLGSIPAEWPDLPDNATLAAEIGWVQANRLAVVEDRPSGGTVVHLERASTPAPSRAALGWLETSIRTYAKYVDIVARALKDEEDEQTAIRRERMAIDEIRALLDEMHRDEAGSKPHP